MPHAATLLIPFLFASLFFSNSYGFLGGDLPQPNTFSNNQLKIQQSSDIVKISPQPEDQTKTVKRYLIFGTGKISDSNTDNFLQTVSSKNGFFSVGLLSDGEASKLKTLGYHVIEDFMVDFHADSDETEISKIGKIVKSADAFERYNYTGAGVKIAIVDTGVDFSNPDIQHSLARDENNHPIMLDADGQGIILTNTTFIANIDENGILRNYTKKLTQNVTSSVYITREGVFLDVKQKGNNTVIEIYNSFFPQAGPQPVFNGTLSDDMKIGEDNRNYIVSKSGMYHLGIMYQGALQGAQARIQVVPVLVVDSKTAGVYDTIIPDLSTSWEDFTRFDLKRGERPNYDFDFTDETQITLGSGNEFLIYDFDDDGKYDYSAGTVGAQVVDLYGVISDKKPTIDQTLKALNGTLLPPLDPKGKFFGVMTDTIRHGTSSAASIASKGTMEYDIYNNTDKYTIRGVAPGAKIVPVKALWFGDTVYAWLWAAGFDNEDNQWKFVGKPRADIISNSWGVSNFPSLKSASGLDILSLILSVLVVPNSVDNTYPGVLMVTSAGNSGHGYGTMGLPNASPYGIAVGATTNNVFVGYGPFKDQPRFGNTTEHFNHMVDFSSRGPSVIGDVKPDLMSIGAYSFTPNTVTKMKKDSTEEPFSLYGGTSMAAPLVAGSAAIVMESMNENNQRHDPFKIKNILTSTATDLKNDPLSQGSGLVNVYDAVQFVNGQDGKFIVHNDATFSNLKKILDGPISGVNYTAIGLEKFEISQTKLPSTSWFGGRLSPGERTTATFTIENPTDQPLDITVKPQTHELIKKTQLNDTTVVHQQDSLLNKSDTFIPNYVRLLDVKEHEDLASYYEDAYPIPDDTSLLILNVNFPFDEFMNKTEPIYANDLKISSLYLYDWLDKNNDTNIDSDEISMVNRGGSWGTVQEIRITNPNDKFENTPVVGVYPVPTRYSYWLGETMNNSTSMNYTLTASYYQKDKWDLIWLDNANIQVPPKSSSEITATIVTPLNSRSGVYQGFLTFEGEKHTVNVPVSFGVKKLVDKKDSTVLVSESSNGDILYGNGYIKGAFDMVNRYMAGDWQQYYFEVADDTINAATIDITWKNPDTSVSAFMIDPIGRIASTNVPSGVFGHFMGWPTIDWLGMSPFSQGGGFFPVENKDDTSIILSTPINQTGTYTLLIHSGLFEGQSITEPVSVAAKFSTILHDDTEPQIMFTVPEFVNDDFTFLPEITDENLASVKYFLDGKEINITSNLIESQTLSDGLHELTIFADDVVGFNTTKSFAFTVDTSPPNLIIQSPKNNTKVSENIIINFDVVDDNLKESDGVIIKLPNGDTIRDETSTQFDVSELEEKQYQIQISAQDKAGNKINQNLYFVVDHSILDSVIQEEPSGGSTLLVIGIIIGAAIGVVSVLLATKRIKLSPKQ